MARVQFSYLVRLLFTESNTYDQCLEDCRRDVVQFPVKLGREVPKARQDLFSEPDVIVLLVLLAPDLAAFLVTPKSYQSIGQI